MSRFDQPTDDSYLFERHEEPYYFCRYCREKIENCTCPCTYCTYCNHEYDDDRWKPYCSRYCETWAAVEKEKGERR